MTTLEQEVRTLQKQVRRQRRWNIALGVVVVVGGLMAAKGMQEVPEVIQAKKFEVVKDDGKVAIRLESLQESIHETTLGSGMISLMNGNGLPAALIGCGVSGGWLLVSGTNPEQGPFMTGLSTATVETGGTWRGGFFLRNGPRIKDDVVHLTIGPDGGGLLRTYDTEGAVTSSSPADPTPNTK